MSNDLIVGNEEMNAAVETVSKSVEKFDWTNLEVISQLKEVYRARHLSDLEFAQFVQLGKATQLNPFKGEIWAVKYGNQLCVFIGRNGYRLMASRSPRWESHRVEAVYSNDEFWLDKNGHYQHKIAGTNMFTKQSRGNLVGAYCVVKLKGTDKTIQVHVSRAEFNATHSQWGKMPEVMLKKVAESHALRMAFPELLAGTYSEAEEEYIKKSSRTEALKEKLINNGYGNDNPENKNKGNTFDAEACDTAAVEQVREQKTVLAGSGSHEEPLSDKQINTIYDLFADKELSGERIKKGLAQFNAENVEALTEYQANKFISQLERVRK